jgi:hypothetical protein
MTENEPLKNKIFCYRCKENALHKGKCKYGFKIEDGVSAVNWLKSKIDLMQNKKELEIGQVIKLCSYLQQAFPDVIKSEEEK